MRFIDLFSGLGGFHAALANLGHQCVFASEIDDTLVELYKKNFGIRPVGDIRKVNIKDIPKHDILCAGFPCQPFSKAGDQKGLECPRWGDLIEYVIKIIKIHQPQFFILENVPNLLKHDNGITWKAIKKKLQLKNTYSVDAKILSPHKFGIPQIRERVYIVGSKNSLEGFNWPEPQETYDPNIEIILDKRPKNAKRLSQQVVECVNVWQEFLDKYPKDQNLPTFPIWSMEFGASYPYTKTTPYKKLKSKYQKGRRIKNQLTKVILESKSYLSLPSHAREKTERFPDWKIEFIRMNRELYRKNRKWIDAWLPKVKKFPPSLQKLEWNCNSGKRDIWQYLIQFRASGVRVKKRTSSPSLVAMTSTQVPIIAWEKRYMTPRECSRLQSMENLKNLPKQSTKAFKALGNAVNVRLVELVANNLLNYNPGKH
ncbi:MAG: DNA (cytosine-5-)-methyltransferase [bacterium]